MPRVGLPAFGHPGVYSLIFTLFDSFSIRPFVYWGGLFIFGAEKHQLILNMKKLFVLAAAAIMVLFAGCNKEESGSIEGKWYCYENGEQHTRLYLELKGGKADLIITAWGDRYKGSYTYDEAKEMLSIVNAEQICRGNAGELGDKSTLTSNLFNDWPSATEADHISLGSPIEMTFKVNGDKATCGFVGLEMEMVRKK